MMNRPCVSVILPCYNCAQYLEEALSSIINQTYKNLEILITNDCSTDETWSILQQYREADNRIILINHGINKGLIYSLNEMMDLANGKYLVRMDSDDISVPTRIEKQVEFMEKNQDISICGTQAKYIDESNYYLGHSNLPNEFGEHCFFLKYFSTLIHPSIMMRASDLKSVRYDEDYMYCEDYELWCRLVYKYKKKIANINEYLLFYRITTTGITLSYSEEQKMKCLQIAKEYNLVEKNDYTIYSMIFWNGEKRNNLDCFQKNYIRLLLKRLSSYSFSPSLCVVEKIIHFLKKNNEKVFLLSLLRQNIVVKTLFSYLKNRIDIWLMRMRRMHI